MSDKIYVGDTGLAVIADCGVSVAGASDIVFEVIKPDGSTAEWPAGLTPDGNSPNLLVHYTEHTDLDQAGTYRLQPRFQLSSWFGKGETAKFKVYDEFK